MYFKKAQDLRSKGLGNLSNVCEYLMRETKEYGARLLSGSS